MLSSTPATAPNVFRSAGTPSNRAETARPACYIDSIEAELAQPMAVEHAAGRAGAYDAIYIPGGHGHVEDLSQCAPLGEVITELPDAGRVVTAACHGPAGLLPANWQDGSRLFQGRRMTAFTNSTLDDTIDGSASVRQGI